MFDSDSRWAWTFLRLPELFADLRLLKAHQSQPSQKLRSLRRAILSTKANLPPGFYWVLVLSEFSGPVWLWLPPTARVEELKAFQLLVDISSLATLAPAQVLWTLEPENLDGVDQKHVLPSRPNPRHQGQELQSDFIFLRQIVEQFKRSIRSPEPRQDAVLPLLAAQRLFAVRLFHNRGLGPNFRPSRM